MANSAKTMGLLVQYFLSQTGSIENSKTLQNIPISRQNVEQAYDYYISNTKRASCHLIG